MGEIQIRRLSGFGDGLFPYILRMDTLPYKENIRWTRIVARCIDVECTRIDLFLQRGGEEYLLRSKAVLDPDDTVGILGTVYAPGDFRVCARFRTPTAANECELYAYGVVQRALPLE